VAPALPHAWTLTGDVSLAHGLRIQVDARDGVLHAFTLRGGNGASLLFATPWQEPVVRGLPDKKLLKTLPGGRFSFTPLAGKQYRVEIDDAASQPPTDAAPAVKVLGRAA